MLKIGKNSIRLSLPIGVICCSITLAYADINGTVFRDLPLNGTSLNHYGIQDPNELGVAGIKVTAYPSGVSVMTGADGDWSLATTGDVRVEFSNMPDYLKESFNGEVSNASVRFVSDGEHVDFALHNPADYSNTPTPSYVTNRQQNGLADDNSNPAIEHVGYEDRGLNQAFHNSNGDQGTAPTPLLDARIEEVGSIWGKAFDKANQRLFVASVLQRHIGFAPTKGAAEVYVLDYGSGSAVFRGSFSLQGMIPANGGDPIDLGSVCRDNGCYDNEGNTGVVDDYLLYSLSLPNIDLDAFAKVGKMSYGDIDFDQQHHRLWLVNLYQKALISVDLSEGYGALDSDDVYQYRINAFSNAPTCVGGELRPWALKIHDGKGYLGAVCDASTSQDINNARGYVLAFDINDSSTPLRFDTVLDFGLNYIKDTLDPNKNWHPWSDIDHKIGTNWKQYTQPILSDIEFDAQNHIYIGFLDRYGLQAGYENFEPISLGREEEEDYEEHGDDFYTKYQKMSVSMRYGLRASRLPQRSLLGSSTLPQEKTKSYGDLLKACFVDGHFELEGTGSCLPLNYGNEFFNDAGVDGSEEFTNGAMALLMGSREILVGAINPHPQGDREDRYKDTLGTVRLSLEDGGIRNWYANIYTADPSLGYNGQSQGMGDIELLSPASPLELGDRVWFDANANGVQDANESGIADVRVELVCDGVIQATAITNSRGEYIFSNDPLRESTPSHRYGITHLIAKTETCLIRIPNIKGTAQQTPLANRVLSPIDQGEGSDAMLNDSDGSEVGLNAQRVIAGSEIPSMGANNHSFDFGFQVAPDDDPLSPPEGTYQPPVAPYTPPVGGGGTTPPPSSPPPTTPPPMEEGEDERVCVGDRVWHDLNRNGLQDENEAGIEDIKVTLYGRDCQTELNVTQTDGLGRYHFSNLSVGDYCIGFSEIPSDYRATFQHRGNSDHNDSDVDPETNTTGRFSLEALEGNACNISMDMGLFEQRACGEIRLVDDIVPANEDSSLTTINVLENDMEVGSEYRIKLLDPEVGERLWRQGEVPVIQEGMLFDTLMIEGEGVWRVVDGLITFDAYDAFDGEVPSPIYYVVQNMACDSLTAGELQYSNVAQVSINTPCQCGCYSSSIPSLNTLSVGMLVLLLSLFGGAMIRREV